MKPVKFLNIKKENNDYKKILLNKTKKIINSSQFILGREVEIFENKLKDLLKTKYVIGVSNGTAALYLSLKFLNLSKNDEVLTVSNSYLSTVSTIVLSGIIREEISIQKRKLRKLGSR